MKRNRINGKAAVGCGVFKNAVILFTVILLSIGCSDSNAQSTNQDGSRLAGTWVEVESEQPGGDTKEPKSVVKDGDTWVFNSDGTGSLRTWKFNYAAISGKLKIRGVYRDNNNSFYGLGDRDYNFVISNDGKTLFIDDKWLKKSTGK